MRYGRDIDASGGDGQVGEWEMSVCWFVVRSRIH
jgi:hypothetical protein